MAIKWSNWVRRFGPSDRTELLVLLDLADHANDAGIAFPGVERMAKRSRLSRRGTQKILRRLERGKWVIPIKHGCGRSNKNGWQLNWDAPLAIDRESMEIGEPVEPEGRTPVRTPEDEIGEPREHKGRTSGLENANRGSPEPYEPNEPNILERFKQLWTAHPKPNRRSEALKLFASAVERGVEPERVIYAAGQYAERVRATEKKYVLGLWRWLDERKWEEFELARPREAAQSANWELNVCRFWGDTLKRHVPISASAMNETTKQRILDLNYASEDDFRKCGVSI